MKDAPPDEKTKFPLRHLGRVMARHAEIRKSGQLPDYRESHEAILLAAASLVFDMDPLQTKPETALVREFLKERAKEWANLYPPHWIKAPAPAEYEPENTTESPKTIKR